MKPLSKSRKKGILSLLLSLVLAVSMLAAVSVVSRAAGYSDWKNQEYDLANGSQVTCTLTKDLIASANREPIRIKEGQNVTLDLNGHTLSRNLSSIRDSGHVIVVLKGATLTIKDSSGNNAGRITGGYSKDGGGIYVNGTLNLEGGTVTDNHAGRYGGGIYVSGGTLNITGGVITGNTSDQDGGGVYTCAGSALTMDGAIVKENTANWGGGVYVRKTASDIKNSDISDNNAHDAGGGLFIVDGKENTVTDSVFKDNEAGQQGGGVKIYEGAALTMTGCALTGNSSIYYGGAVYNSGTLSMENCTVTDCKANHGGGIYVDENASMNITGGAINGNSARVAGGLFMNNISATINGVEFAGNKAEQKGGAVFHMYGDKNAILVMENCTVRDNTAEIGGGLTLWENTHLKNCIIKNNTATGNYKYQYLEGCGGGVCISISTYGTMRFDNTEFLDNTANGTGGGICAQGPCQVVLHECNMKGNHANVEAGGIYTYLGTKLALLGADIEENTAQKSCGGVYVSDTIVSMKGWVVIKDNSTDEGHIEQKDMLLGSKSYIDSPGLYARSKIHVATDVRFVESVYAKNISKYQTKYFVIDSNATKFTGTAYISTPIVASLFGNGSMIVLIVMAALAVAAIAIVIIVKKRKGGAVNHDGKE